MAWLDQVSGLLLGGHRGFDHLPDRHDRKPYRIEKGVQGFLGDVLGGEAGTSFAGIATVSSAMGSPSASCSRVNSTTCSLWETCSWRAVRGPAGPRSKSRTRLLGTKPLLCMILAE